MKRLPRTVISLGLVSLFTDMSSEMIYPLLPAFLVTLGAGGAFIGLVDGVAETTSALLKLASGIWADKVERKKPLVLIGYGIASVVRPLVALARAPWHVLAVRFTDRIGKGVRTSPRDALVAHAVDKDSRGAAFGFHRAMDNAGALLGPLLAWALINWAGASDRGTFALSAIPAALAMAVLIFGVRDADRDRERERDRTPVVATHPALRAGAHAGAGGSISRGSDTPAKLPRPLKTYLAVVAVFTLGSSSDFFLLLRAHDCGVPIASAPLIWAMLSAVKAGLNTPLGALSDRVGRRAVILIGWAIYALAYVGFALATETWHAWALFAIYGIYYGFTEGAEKALVADFAPAALRGRAFGWYNGVVGVCALPASLGFGLIWDHVSHGAAFLVGAGLAGAAALGLALLPTRGQDQE